MVALSFVGCLPGSLVSFWACFSPCGRSSFWSLDVFTSSAGPFSLSDVHVVRLGDFGTSFTHGSGCLHGFHSGLAFVGS